ncbi:U3-containing 90S pre-ribosomal complex subunit-domain containing protein [Suillus paluster]|uniref:U3-containing 90S pre-ribosomal complex subunit-domain containing protein n=1 Tax=Suillus paluster TaxID=48578 RepID=UPI001B87D39C|nr:U3-containing 90S pre-ribosomal complex subunit-domain containing protein [Suillus paluster]KAG1756282.1 U3-containing 90S pre-ribosomal complex subunit-domain containing protein [Suillus paluster]
MNGQRGDDLDDDFVPDELVATSDEEDNGPGDDISGLLSADEDVEEAEATIKEKSATEKKRKRREKEKERKAKKRKLAETVEVIEPLSVAAQPAHNLADYLSSMQAKAFPAMSGIELGDVMIPESSIADTTLWTGSRSLDHLVEFIIEVLPALHTRLSQRSKVNGAPTLLFIAGAALRVADATRVLRDKRLRREKGADVAKLFARHFKLEEHVSYLKRSKIGSAVGTPGRIGKLLCETGELNTTLENNMSETFSDALSVAQLTHIILDVSYQDTKKRSLLDIPETRDEVFRTVLGAPKVLKGIQEGKIQLVLL